MPTEELWESLKEDAGTISSAEPMPDIELDTGFSPWSVMHVGGIELADGEQLIRKKAYYYFQPEGSDGFLNTAGFEMIAKNTVYSVGGVDMGSSNARKTYDPPSTQADGATRWIYGEEPIVYEGAILNEEKSTEDSEWEEMKAFIGAHYQAAPFTSFREVEHYLNWYDYSAEELNFGFNWKNDQAEWMQSNQLRAFNKESNPLTGEFNADTQYNFNAEAPWLDNWTNPEYSAGLTMGVILTEESAPTGTDPGTFPTSPGPDGMVITAGFPGAHIETAGFENTLNTILPDWYVRSMKVRFKTPRQVAGIVANYLDALAMYVQNTGYTTVLKRALSSETQIVKRFTNREFTAMQTSTMTTAYSVDHDASCCVVTVPLPEGEAPDGVPSATEPLTSYVIPLPVPADASSPTGEF